MTKARPGPSAAWKTQRAAQQPRLCHKLGKIRWKSLFVLAFYGLKLLSTEQVHRTNEAPRATYIIQFLGQITGFHFVGNFRKLLWERCVQLGKPVGNIVQSDAVLRQLKGVQQ